MNKPSRFVGIDLCRGLAAFAVILVHSGDETWGIPITEQARQFRYLFYFAVPFFLAASFYFSTKKSPLNIAISFWQKKMQRILVPYLFWSLFYLIFKSIVFFMSDRTSEIQKLLSDPLAIILFGGASYHLYFLPLLASGTLLLCLANYFTQKQNPLALLSLFSVLSIVVYQLLLASNNSFDLGTYTAFDRVLDSTTATGWNYSILRIFLVNLAWILRCLPYFFIAMLINQFLLQNNCKWLYKQQTAVLLFLVFLSVDIMGKNFIPSAVNEIAIAFLLLLWGISISHYFKDNKYNAVITNLGSCSFGIYLIHPLIKSVIEIVIIKLIPQLTQSVSLTSMLVYSVSSFLISWILVALLLKNKVFSQYM